MYEVEYTITGFDKHFERDFKTFEAARTWAKENCRGWYTIARYYD